MPIFYTDVPQLVTGTVATIQGSVVTASIAGPVTITSSLAAPAWVTGTITVQGGGGGAVTQGGPWNTLVSGVVGVVQSGAFTVQVSGSPSSVVWVTGAVGSPVFVGQTASWLVNTGTFPSNITVNTGTMPVVVVSTGTFPVVTVSQSNVPVGVVTVTSAFATPVWVNTTGTITVNTGTFPTVTVSQSNIPAGTITVSQSNIPAGSVTVTSAFATPVWVNTTGTITVNTGTFPTITVASHAVTQGGAWGVLVSGAVGILQSGALGAQVSGVVGVVQSGAFSTQVSGSVTASQDKAGNASLVTFEVGNTSIVLLASNANRKGATIFNLDQTVFIGLGQTPTVTLYHAKVPSSSYYEIPWNFTGAVNSIAAVSGQTVNVGEFTA